jgi:hypothetical protein
VLATWLVRMPGAASAVSGAYLLPRTLLSVIDPGLPLPPLLLIPAMVFDVLVWLQWPDLSRLWPGRARGWRKKTTVAREARPWRLGLASAGFVLVGLVVFSATGTGS